MRMVCIILSIFISLCAQAQTVFGKWKTIDDNTGKAKSIIEIYEYNGKLYGKIIQLFREPQQDQNPVCSKCEDDRKDQLVLGMILIRDLELKDGYYKDGTICDPTNGKVYDCSLWLDASDSNKLKVRGYYGFIYRTQTWLRIG